MERVVGLGLCVQDEVFLVDGFGQREGTSRFRAHRSAPGGMVTNAVVAAAGEGVQAHLLSSLGRDGLGRRIAAELKARGIVTRRLIHSDATPTTTAVVLVEPKSGRRRFIVADRRKVEKAAPTLDLAPIRPGAVLLVDGHFSDQCKAAMQLARARGVPVVADFSDARPAYRELLPLVDFLIVPLDFVHEWGAGGPRMTLRALHKQFGGTPVVTLGAKGALAFDRGSMVEIPAPRVRVVDTTGAGDVFHGVFAAALAQRCPVRAALRRAAIRAAHSCRYLGGIPPLS